MVVSLTKDDAKELECLCEEAVSKGKEVFIRCTSSL